MSINSRNNIKEWIHHRLKRLLLENNQESFLGDLIIRDVKIGDSLPHFSNPQLLKFSMDDDLLINFDIEYTGGFSLQLATDTTITVPILVILNNTGIFYKTNQSSDHC